MKKSIIGAGVVAAMSLTSAASAAESLAFPRVKLRNHLTSVYTCAGGAKLTVSYSNTVDGQSFAVVPIHGKTFVMVNTLAASGAKYQADRYIWWTKGPRADLYDATAGENGPPILANCTSSK